MFGFEAQLTPGGWILILANPPYVTEAELALLAPELSFELEGGAVCPGEGLAFYRHIAPAYRPARWHPAVGWPLRSAGAGRGGAAAIAGGGVSKCSAAGIFRKQSGRFGSKNGN